MDKQEAQIATLQASVQQLYATLQDYANKYSVLCEENKTLKERDNQVTVQEPSTETPESVVQIAEVGVLSSEHPPQQTSVPTTSTTAEPVATSTVPADKEPLATSKGMSEN